MEMNISKKIINLIITMFFIFIVIVLFLIIALKVTYFHIVGHSMNPTLTEGELVIAWPQKGYQRGDIISFTSEDGTAIKRIIGIPGDKVYIDEEGNVEVNDTAITEDYVTTKCQGEIETDNPYTVEANEYYVLGDNRCDSKDSRFLKVGAISEDKISNKIFFSLTNFHKIK